MSKKSLKNWIWDDLGLHLGGVWGALGRLLAAFGRLLGVKNRAFFKHWPNMGSKRPFGSILGGSWEDLGGFWEGLGRILADFWMDFRKIWERIWERVKEFEKSCSRVSK